MVPSINGTTAGWLGRIKSVLPGRWFADNNPVLDTALTGVADMYAWLWAMLSYVALQARVATATGAYLDAISWDFYAGNLPRLLNEKDAAFSARIRLNFFAPKATRAAVIRAITNLTGRAPVIFEPSNTGDTGAYYNAASPYVGGGLAYGTAGGYGSLLIPFQYFITAYRVLDVGVGVVGGYGVAAGAGAYANAAGTGYAGGSAGAIEYTNPAMWSGAVTDATIFAAIAAVNPAAVTAWARLSY